MNLHTVLSRINKVMEIKGLPLDVMGTKYPDATAMKAFLETLQRKAYPFIVQVISAEELESLTLVASGKGELSSRNIATLSTIATALERGYSIVQRQTFTLSEKSLAQQGLVDMGLSEPYVIFAMTMINSYHRSKVCQANRENKTIMLDNVIIRQNSNGTVTVENYPCVCYPSAWRLFACEFMKGSSSFQRLTDNPMAI